MHFVAIWEQAAYPILLGRQHPVNHPGYPHMGSFFAVQAVLVRCDFFSWHRISSALLHQ